MHNMKFLIRTDLLKPAKTANVDKSVNLLSSSHSFSSDGYLNCMLPSLQVNNTTHMQQYHN